MPDHGFRPETRQPTENELRKMLDAREIEKEMERKRLGGKVTTVLLVFCILLVGVILCFPGRRPMVSGGSKENPELAAAVKVAMSAQKNPQESAIPQELKPFSVKSGDSDHTADIRFATELLKFIQPPAPHDAPPKPASR